MTHKRKKFQSTNGVVHLIERERTRCGLHFPYLRGASIIPLDDVEITCTWCRVNKAITNDGIVHSVRLIHDGRLGYWWSACSQEMRMEMRGALDKPITCLRCLAEQT